MADARAFDQWNIVKKSLQQRDKLEFFNERQIWWCNIGQNLGSEVYGKGETFTRPVLIYKKLSRELFLALPLSTKIKRGTWYVSIRFHRQTVAVLLNQARILDKKRLVARLGQVSGGNFLKTKTGFNNLFSF